MTISEVDQKFMLRCEEVRRGSHDPHRTVGAVIVDKNLSLVSEGTNQPPEAFGFSRSDTVDQVNREPQSKYFLLEHAERNALFNAYRNGTADRLVGGTMYCTLLPCADCARAIVASGISRLVIPEQPADPVRDLKWSDHYRFAKQILALAAIEVDVVNFYEHGQTQSFLTGS